MTPAEEWSHKSRRLLSPHSLSHTQQRQDPKRSPQLVGTNTQLYTTQSNDFSTPHDTGSPSMSPSEQENGKISMKTKNQNWSIVVTVLANWSSQYISAKLLRLIHPGTFTSMYHLYWYLFRSQNRRPLNLYRYLCRLAAPWMKSRWIKGTAKSFCPIVYDF